MTVKYRSTAIATRVTDEEAAPSQATFPAVSVLHKLNPVAPPGWVKVFFKI